MSESNRNPLLTSPQNPYVKEIVSLRKDGNERKASRRFFIEGRRVVAAALDAPDLQIKDLIYCDKLIHDEANPLIRKAQTRGIRLVPVSKDVFKKMADVQTPQGIAAVVEQPRFEVSLLKRPQAFLVAACGIQDPGNLGTLIRSCDAAGASGLLILDGTVDPYNSKVIRSTAASLIHLPIERLDNARFLALASEVKATLVAAAAHRGKPYRKFDWQRRPLVLCIGNEGEGLPASIEEACSEAVTIPIRGAAESLNAAVAASILIFEALAL